MLFETPNFTVRELTPAEIPVLQALFEANADYFITVGGQPPRADEAQQEFDEQVPPHLSCSTRWFAGVFDSRAQLRGLIVLVSDLCAPGVWHTALFLIDGPLRGTGAALELHGALEAFATKAGAHWLRLAVIDGNLRAQRFWAACGYRQVRSRPLQNASGEAKVSLVLIKPLAGGSLTQYLQRVPRDAPGSDLP